VRWKAGSEEAAAGGAADCLFAGGHGRAALEGAADWSLPQCTRLRLPRGVRPWTGGDPHDPGGHVTPITLLSELEGRRRWSHRLGQWRPQALGQSACRASQSQGRQHLGPAESHISREQSRRQHRNPLTTALIFLTTALRPPSHDFYGCRKIQTNGQTDFRNSNKQMSFGEGWGRDKYKVENISIIENKEKTDSMEENGRIIGQTNLMMPREIMD
jgi:hypothetical protein